jgi:hypothetical protein
MYTNGNDSEVAFRSGYALNEARGLATSGHPFHGLTAIAHDIVSSAHHLPDSELMRIAGCLRTLADEVMAVVDRRCGARPAPRLVVDNTRR